MTFNNVHSVPLLKHKMITQIKTTTIQSFSQANTMITLQSLSQNKENLNTKRRLCDDCKEVKPFIKLKRVKPPYSLFYYMSRVLSIRRACVQ